MSRSFLPFSSAAPYAGLKQVDIPASTRDLLFDTLITIGMPPSTRHDLLKRARKSTAQPQWRPPIEATVTSYEF